MKIATVLISWLFFAWVVVAAYAEVPVITIAERNALLMQLANAELERARNSPLRAPPEAE